MCKASASRKILYRAADTTQALFYVFREITFDKLIVKVKRKGDQLLLYEGLYKDECFVPFPTSLVKDGDDKKAILVYMACGDAYAYMDVALKLMLEDISMDLLDFATKPRNKNPLKIREFWYTGQEAYSNHVRHEALKVKLKDGSMFVIDLTGAQFGYHVPVMPINLYDKIWAEVSDSEQPFGYHRRYMQEIMKKDTLQSQIRTSHETIYRYFNNAITAWEQSRMPLHAMLKLKEKDFFDTQQKLIHSVAEFVRRSKKRADEHGWLRLNWRPSKADIQEVDSKNAAIAKITEEETDEEEVAEHPGAESSNDHTVLSIQGLKL
ncbi:MAG: hypothetical protein Q9209_001705 [Squamulea sp. 1 TL-2023]